MPPSQHAQSNRRCDGMRAARDRGLDAPRPVQWHRLKIARFRSEASKQSRETRARSLPLCRNQDAGSRRSVCSLKGGAALSAGRGMLNGRHRQNVKITQDSHGLRCKRYLVLPPHLRARGRNSPNSRLQIELLPLGQPQFPGRVKTSGGASAQLSSPAGPRSRRAPAASRLRPQDQGSLPDAWASAG